MELTFSPGEISKLISGERGPFKQTAISGNLLLIGHGQHFYIYEVASQQNLLSLEMEGYFGHFYVHDVYFFVADACNLYCINHSGDVIWKTTDLGIDGVVIEKFTENEIHGSGEWDPPGGWVKFILSLNSGIKKPLSKKIIIEKIRYVLDFIPLLILTAWAVILVADTLAVGTEFYWKHIVAFAVLPVNYALFAWRHKVSVIATGVILLMGLVGLLSYTYGIFTGWIGIGESGDSQFRIYFGHPMFFVWLVLHFILSGRYYVGVLTKKYWNGLS